MTPDMLENITFEELEIGQSAELKRTLTQKDIELFAAVSGDVNPAHMDEHYAENSLFHGVIGHGMWSGGLISTVLGTELPGPGTIYLEQDMRFKKPVMLGDQVTVRVSVKSKRDDKPVVMFDCVCLNEKGDTLVEGTATVLAPTEKIRIPRPDIPWVDIREKDHYKGTMEKCRAFGILKVAVVHPVQANVIEAVAEAVEENLIVPVLIGPEARIKAAIKESGVNARGWQIISTAHSHAAAAKAAKMAASGEVGAIMKGSLHTEELLEAVVPSSAGLRTERRISHVYLMNIPTYHKPLMITDAAINIAPTLEQKADICQNAIDAWHVLFNHEHGDPKVAILSATEEVTSRIPSTIDAAALCKMADRGQIKEGRLDGPLAFDNAISAQAVKDKNIISEVAGDADILVVPDIEAGNALAKQLIFLGTADAAGIVLGARVPIILTSRADSKRTRMFSCGVAMALSAARQEGKIK
ncbi:MAG TPA: bifunctional enoyl-CoA hydratase/phosphate acetyltransferase [Candidatus Omnitrophota bacterium]|nr:bifunctional enoyl-CoA hydratase/phosphate acetyltransferase [Candidatus Omnitrophota bacterium]